MASPIAGAGGLVCFLSRSDECTVSSTNGAGKAAAVVPGLEQALGEGSREQSVRSLRGAGAVFAGRFPRARSHRSCSRPAGAGKGQRRGGCGGAAEGRGSLAISPLCTPQRGISRAEPKEEPALPSAPAPAAGVSWPGQPRMERLGGSGLWAQGSGLWAGPASAGELFHRENNCSLHAYSKATGISFALDPGGGRKCECPPGKRKLPKSESLKKQMWVCTFCTFSL